jgi:hypothetical protein
MLKVVNYLIGVVISILSIIICIAGVDAATIPAASCSQSDVLTAVNKASNGDTISIPAGACTWTSGITIGSSSSRTKMVKLLGAGTDASTGTRITCNTTAVTAWLSHTISGLEISNIRFIEGSSGEPWAIALKGHADTETSLFRIHNCYFQYASNSGDNSIIIGGLNTYGTPEAGHPYIWGLLDNNTFKGNATVQGIDIAPLYSSDLGLSNQGHEAWKNVELEDHQGTWRNVFIENNLIDCRPGWADGRAFMDGNGGSAYVFRHNILYNAWVANHDPGSSNLRGHKWMEVYDNIFALDYVGDGSNTAINVRSGTAVIYNNQFYDASRKGAYVVSGTDKWDNYMQLEYYRDCYNDGGGSATPCRNDILCGRDSKLGCDNKNDTSGWICRDQVGAKKGSSEPTWVFGYRWDTEPVVEWNNNYTRAVTFNVYQWPGCTVSNYIRERRDFIGHSSCIGYMGEEICSTFWDDVNNKKKSYTAFDYPHPLGSTSIPFRPAPPTGVRIE